MKKVKWVLRVILIAPFILGLPIGNKIMSARPGELDNIQMTQFESIVAIPGIIGCCVVGLAVIGCIVCFIQWFIWRPLRWIFKTD